jgi:hypothetical protein
VTWAPDWGFRWKVLVQSEFDDLYEPTATTSGPVPPAAPDDVFDPDAAEVRLQAYADGATFHQCWDTHAMARGDITTILEELKLLRNYAETLAQKEAAR